jgi:alpha-N-arabinofuranosidase
MWKKLWLAGSLVCSGAALMAQRTMDVWPSRVTVPVSPNMWGIFFEDINFGADGGLYAELVKNRSFEFATPKMGWREAGNGSVLIVNHVADNRNNPRYAAVTVTDTFTVTNEGFRGMGIKASAQYDFSLLARQAAGNTRVIVRLLDSRNQVIGETTLPPFTGQWQKHTASLTARATEARGKLQLVFTGKGNTDIDMVSLFPRDTWKGRPGGLRKDLVQLLADLKPGFVRFPGGCIVEGRDLLNRYQWKESVGDVYNRKLMINRWNTEFAHRSAPDYFQTFGLGFYEYFQLAEDIGAQPLPILNCGMACQYNTGEVVSLNELDPYIQDALDLVAFANSPVTGKWGKLRASMGHPAPFHLTMLGIGNEQWGEQYLERYKAFEKAFKQQYPDIRLVAAAGPSPKGKEFDLAWKAFPATKVSMLDEHYYQNPSWFLNNATRYDQYDRKGPKVFAGEYASHDKETGNEAESRNTWLSALTEAAFMTGLERNADVVQMAAYAPLLAHVDAWQWRPDLIWFDNLRAVATPNYYVQQLYSLNKGTEEVEIRENGATIAGRDSLYACAAIDRKAGKLILKLVNAAARPVAIRLNIRDLPAGTTTGELTVLTADSLKAINTLTATAVQPRRQALQLNGSIPELQLAAYSLSVITLPFKQSK